MQKINRTYFQIAIILLCFGTLKSEAKVIAEHAQQEAQSDQDLIKLSEAFGHFIGKNLKNPGIEFDLESFIKGIRDGAAGKPAPLSEEQYETLMVAFQKKALAKLSQINLDEAELFLKENLQNPDVKVIEEGKLQYQILKKGNGPEVFPDDSPRVRLTGKLMDGTLFASTDELGEELTIFLPQSIRGLQLGIAGMHEGEIRRLFVHPEFGFSDSENLPPNTLLIFDIEVISANDTSEESDPANSDEFSSNISEETPLEEESPQFPSSTW